MQRALIIHGMPNKLEYYSQDFDSPSNSHWLPWLQKQLLCNGILAQTPEMPNPYIPNYDLWKSTFEQYVIDDETILVGHSCGAGFLLRYLSESPISVLKLILVAPYISPEDLDDARDMFAGIVLDRNLSSRIGKIIIFASNDDMKVIQDSVEIILYNVDNIELHNFDGYGHFCFDDMKTRSFPELLNMIID